MATALASASGQGAVRSDTAMTGEISLSGLVLPVGGIKEKRPRIARAFAGLALPKANQKDLKDAAVARDEFADLHPGRTDQEEVLPQAFNKDVDFDGPTGTARRISCIKNKRPTQAGASPLHKTFLAHPSQLGTFQRATSQNSWMRAASDSCSLTRSGPRIATPKRRARNFAKKAE
ncbi:MAG: S16 family serine protease [Nitrospira sp.]